MGNALELPAINNIMDLTEADLSTICRYGFCYVKTPGGEDFQSCIKRTRETAFDFFRKSTEYKNQWKTNGTASGYADRRQSLSQQGLEQCFFSPSDPIAPFSYLLEDILKITQSYVDEMALPLLNKIFEFCDLKEYFEEATYNNFQSFAFCYYPHPTNDSKAGMNPHFDTGLLTVLDVSQESLEVFIEGSWRPIPPKKGHTAINLSTTLKLMTGGRVTPALHRVNPPTQERLSFGLFINRCLSEPIMDYTTDVELHAKASTFVTEEFNNHYGTND